MSLVAISVDSLEDSVALAGRLGINFPLLEDEGLKAATEFGVAMKGEDIAVPSIFIVHKGKIAYQYVGDSIMDRPDAERVLLELDLVMSKDEAANK